MWRDRVAMPAPIAATATVAVETPAGHATTPPNVLTVNLPAGCSGGTVNLLGQARSRWRKFGFTVEGVIAAAKAQLAAHKK
jgi:hypothetical protein